MDEYIFLTSSFFIKYSDGRFDLGCMCCLDKFWDVDTNIVDRSDDGYSLQKSCVEEGYKEKSMKHMQIGGVLLTGKVDDTSDH